MNEEDLIKLLDGFVSSGGYSIKPQYEEGKQNFSVVKGEASSTKVKESFAAVKLGEKEEAEVDVFDGNQRIDCPTCGDIPNLMVDEDEEFDI